MKYLNQIYYEGLGKTLYIPIENKIKKIKRKKVANNLIILLKVFYMIFAITIAIILLIIEL